MIKPDTVIYADENSEAGVASARAWLKQQGLTGDDVRLVKKDNLCLAIAKRPLNPKPTSCGSA